MNDKDRLPSDQPVSLDGVDTENSNQETSPTVASQENFDMNHDFSTEASGDIVTSAEEVQPENNSSLDLGQESSSSPDGASNFSESIPVEQEQPTQPLGTTTPIEGLVGASTPVESVVPAVEPAVVQSQPITPLAPPFGSQPQKSKKGLIAGLIIGGIALVLLVSAALLYFLWYQKPEKVVNDGIVGLMNAKQVSSDFTMEGSFKTSSTSSSSTPIKINVNSKITADAYSATASISVTPTDIGEINLGGEAVIINDTVYFKATKVKETYEKIVGVYIDSQMSLYKSYYSASQLSQIKTQAQAQLDKSVLPIVNELDNKWIKITKDELGESSASAKCYSDTLFAYQKDEKSKKELATLYEKNGNPFVIEGNKLTGDDGMIGYTVRIDKEKYDSYVASLESTELGKKLKDCGGTTNSPTSSSSTSSEAQQQVSKASFEIWVTPLTHELKKVVVIPATDSSNSSTSVTFKTFEITADTKASIKITEPSDATSFDVVQKKIEALTSSN